MGPAIAVEGLSKVYGGEVRANDDLTFSVPTGEIFGYLGPNGAGKTTTIRAMLGFHAPTEGTVRLFGHDVREESALIEAKERVGYLPSTPGFDGTVTGAEFLDYQAELKGDSRRGEMLELFDPPLERKIREFSSGNQQMLAIVQAFMHDPDLAILDEPTAGLDPLKQERFNRFLREERDRGTTVFFSSHILGEVRRVCDRVGIIRGGELVALEDIDDLLNRGGKRVRVHTAEPLAREELALDGVVEFESVGRESQFTFAGDYNRLVAALADHDIVDLEIDEPPIEDVFMHFYGETDGAVDDEPAADAPEGADDGEDAEGRADV
jgi:ABC-2 type transport system ATP-binding protein